MLQYRLKLRYVIAMIVERILYSYLSGEAGA